MSEKYYHGEKISNYGVERGFVDYETLSRVVGGTVLCNNMANRYGEALYEVSGTVFDEETEEFKEILQWFFISDYGAEFLIDKTSEIVLYDEDLGVYVWGVTHWGTSWVHVLTNIKIPE